MKGLVYRLAYNGEVVSFKMGRRKRARKGAYLNRSVTDEQRGSQPFQRNLGAAGRSGRFFRVERYGSRNERLTSQYRLGLHEKQLTDLWQHHYYMRDGKLQSDKRRYEHPSTVDA